MSDTPIRDARDAFRRKARVDAATWLGLMALVGVSLAAAYLAPQSVALAADLLVAFAQVALLLTFFMQLRGARALILLTCLYASLFVVVMFGLTFEDLFTRV